MPTINQLIASPRVIQKSRKKVPALQQPPHKRGVYTPVSPPSPTQPNAAARQPAPARPPH